MNNVRPEDLKVGDNFPSPRWEEGTVRVVCTLGACDHDPSRHDSVHVRGSNGNEWFIPLIPDEPIHVCETNTCFLDNPIVYRVTLDEIEELPHRSANIHSR